MQIASVTAQGRGVADHLLDTTARTLANSGIRVLGALRPVRADAEPGHCDSDLMLLPDGPVVQITQNLGAGSTACRMDAAALEDAVGRVMARLDSQGADILILNKFGQSEAEGRGFRALIAQALGLGVPVLIGLSDTHRPAFERFTDGVASTLPPDADSILAWCHSATHPNDRPQDRSRP